MLRSQARCCAPSLALCALSWALFVAPAWSQDAPDYARTGFHLGVGGTAAFSDFDYDIESLGVSEIYSTRFDPDFDTSAGAQLRIGYRVHDFVDLEFEYEWLEGFDSRRGDPALELDTHQLFANTRILPLTGRWQPYAYFGLGLLIVNTEIVDSSFDKPYDVDVGFAMRFGAGLEYYVTRHWVVGIEGGYGVPTGDVEDANYGTLGFTFRYRF